MATLAAANAWQNVISTGVRPLACARADSEDLTKSRQGASVFWRRTSARHGDARLLTRISESIQSEERNHVERAPDP